MPVVPYVDPNTIHNPATGTVAPASWGDQIRNNGEFLIDPPACSISQAAATTITAQTSPPTVLGPTALENFDNDAMHSDVTNRSRITIQTAGRYLLLGNAYTSSYLGTGNDTFIRISFRIDGTTAVGGSQLKRGTVTGDVRLTAARSLVLTAGQYVEMTATQNMGDPFTVTLDEFVVIYLTR